MARYRKKPIVVEAVQWREDGDHLKVIPYRNRAGITNNRCKHCEKPLFFHGWIQTLEGGHIVCSGDYIIKGVKGEFYPCKPDIFEQTYELIE